MFCGEGSCPGAAKKKRRSSVGSRFLTKKRIVIVGAGFAGLSAARTIQGTSGERIEVIILEAGTQVGGRARSAQLPSGAAVEFGATWFHGICGNPLYDIAVWEGLVRDLRGDPGLKRHEIHWKVDFARLHCPELLAGCLRDAAEEALDGFQEGAMELSGEHPSTQASVGAFLRDKFDKAVQSTRSMSPEQLAVFAEAWLFREKQQCAFDGFFSSDDVSATFPWEFETLDGPNMPVPGGFQAIAQSLAAPVDVRFGHTVTNIEWGSGGVSISCSNGVELEADAVIVTTSVGVLQAKHKTLFTPPLPDWKQAALAGIRLGVADKIFLEFDIDQDAVEAAGKQASCHQAAKDTDTHVPLGHPPAGSPQQPSQQQCQQQSCLARQPAAPAAAAAAAVGPTDASSPVNHEEPWNMGRRGVAGQAPAELGVFSMAGMVAASGAPSGSGRSDSGVTAGLLCVSEDRTALAPRRAATSSDLSGDDWTGSGVARQGSDARLDAERSANSDGDTRMNAATSSRSRRPKQRKEIRSYALMWPIQQPLTLGTAGSEAAQRSLPGGLPHAPPAGLPTWLSGLHSIRFEPGPDWIQPSDEERYHAQVQAKTQPAGQQQSGSVPRIARTAGAVLWITGDAALEMERLSEDEVQQGVMQLLAAFPAVPLPLGAQLPPRVVRSSWGSDPCFLGSYSYTRAGVPDGEVVDVMAEPLIADDGMPVVMFAGEATHRSYMGTAHGAYLSGYREAMRFMSSLEQQDALLSWGLARAAAAAAVDRDRGRSNGTSMPTSGSVLANA